MDWTISIDAVLDPMFGAPICPSSLLRNNTGARRIVLERGAYCTDILYLYQLSVVPCRWTPSNTVLGVSL